MTSDNTPTTGPALQPGAAAVDPDQVLAAFRDLHHRIRVENDTYLTRDDGTEDPSACAEHHDRLEALYAEAADTMAALDAHLATGGQLPAAWSDAHPWHTDHRPTPGFGHRLFPRPGAIPTTSAGGPDMNHSHYDPASATASAHSGSGTADATRARLAAAFALPFGPVREQRITESVLELIAVEISARHPAITTVLFDWQPYGGLGVAGFHDRRGNPVADHDLDLDITHYASDIRATTDTALTPTRPGEPGLFRLDLTKATTSATNPPGLVAAHTLRAGHRLDHGKQVHAVTRREDHLDIAFDDGTWWCDVPARHPITLWDGNPSTRCYPFAFLAADEYRIYRHETDHNPTHRPGAPGDENPPTRTPGVGVRARITGPRPGHPDPVETFTAESPETP